MSAGLLPDNMFEALLPEYAFNSKVPRRLQRRYLLSLFLVSVAMGGLVTLFFMAENYSRVIMSGFALVTTLVMNVVCWRRFKKSSPRNAILEPWR
jgi:membrane associated rhomboid family serine protease